MNATVRAVAAGLLACRPGTGVVADQQPGTWQHEAVIVWRDAVTSVAFELSHIPGFDPHKFWDLCGYTPVAQTAPTLSSAVTA